MLTPDYWQWRTGIEIRRFGVTRRRTPRVVSLPARVHGQDALRKLRCPRSVRRTHNPLEASCRGFQCSVRFACALHVYLSLLLRALQH